MRMGAWSIVVGAASYEFRMQIRRKAVWITTLLFGLLVFTGGTNPWNLPDDTPLTEVVVIWSEVLQMFMPVALGVLLADRVPRDRRTRASELLDAVPATPGGRLLGKYAGATLATLVPMFLVYAAGVGYAVVDRGEPQALLLGLLAFLTTCLPGLLFVAAFSVACPAVLWVPLYQFLFVGYWFWGNLLNPQGAIPTISGTWLTPLGEYMRNGFFGVESLWIGDAAAWEGAASACLLLTLAALALYCAHRYLLREQARR